MFAVIFEVNPKPERWEAYLGYAKLLRPELEQIDGFIDNERFSSLRRKGWLLSLSIWRDEKAVVRWRTRARHHEVQQKGRTEVFGDYHLRVGEIIANNRLPAGEVLREQRFDETAAAAKLIALSEAAPEGLSAEPDAGTIAARLGGVDIGNPGLVDWNVFDEHYPAGKIHSPYVLAGCGGCRSLAARRPGYSPPLRSRDPRLRNVRPCRSAAILPAGAEG